MYELVKIHLRCGMSESCNQSCHCLTLLIHDYLRQAYKATVVKCDQHELQPYTHLFHNFLTSRVKKSTLVALLLLYLLTRHFTIITLFLRLFLTSKEPSVTADIIL